jgi:hypothetical protein
LRAQTEGNGTLRTDCLRTIRVESVQPVSNVEVGVSNKVDRMEKTRSDMAAEWQLAP